MPLNRKETRWRRNRKFGDVYGGRLRPKLTNNIFDRAHSLQAPDEGADLPLLLQDNPSRNFFFPINASEARKAIEELPEFDVDGLTHIWCRRPSGAQVREDNAPLAQFVCGSGVRAIILYPWPIDRLISWDRRPSRRVYNEYGRSGITIRKIGARWQAKPTLEQLRRFTIQSVLYHEVGHHTDWYDRRWSLANEKQTEEFADQYAITYTRQANRFVDKMSSEFGASDND